MLIDAHLDLAFNAVANGADLTLPLDALRTSPFGQMMTARQETPMVALPELRAADVRIVFGTIFVAAAGTVFNMQGPTYSTAAEANKLGWEQIHYYHQLAAQAEATLVQNQADVLAVLEGAVSQPGIVLLMEGADPIRDAAELEQWVQAGLRVVGPAWGATRYSGGTGAPGPLTALGRELMDALQHYNLTLDTSHMADESFWEALRLHAGPVIASHSNCRALVPGDRQLSDDMIRAIVARDGVIGVVLYNNYLQADYDQRDGKTVPLEAVVRQIEHICALTGDTKHVGIGSDFDGGLGVEWTPLGLDSCADLPRIGDALRAVGWRDDDIARVLGGNWARWLRGILPD